MCSLHAALPTFSHFEWNMLSENDHVPLMNKMLQGRYPPGSTVKPMNALALLRAGIDPHQTVFCGGAIRVGTGVFHCWKRGGHGHTDMRRAVAQSCDVYFRSEEHTSEPPVTNAHLVCRLLLEKKKQKYRISVQHQSNNKQ